MSTDTVPGRPADDVAQLYRADGFEVQVVDLDTNAIVDAELNAGRIRIATRNGFVVQASQGWQATGSAHTQHRVEVGNHRAHTLSILDEHLSTTLSMKLCRWCAAQPRQPLLAPALTCQFTPTGSTPPSFNPRVLDLISAMPVAVGGRLVCGPTVPRRAGHASRRGPRGPSRQGPATQLSWLTVRGDTRVVGGLAELRFIRRRLGRREVVPVGVP